MPLGVLISISYQIMRDMTKSKRVEEDDRVVSRVVRVKMSPKIEPPSRIRRNSGIFTGDCLNIFDPKGLHLTSDVVSNPFWDKLAQREVELSLDFSPENAFEEMIKWTEEGKLWRYPIDNEQGLFLSHIRGGHF